MSFVEKWSKNTENSNILIFSVVLSHNIWAFKIAAQNIKQIIIIKPWGQNSGNRAKSLCVATVCWVQWNNMCQYSQAVVKENRCDCVLWCVFLSPTRSHIQLAEWFFPFVSLLFVCFFIRLLPQSFISIFFFWENLRMQNVLDGLMRYSSRWETNNNNNKKQCGKLSYWNETTIHECGVNCVCFVVDLDSNIRSS